MADEMSDSSSYGKTSTVYGAIVTLVSTTVSLAFGVVNAVGDGAPLSEGAVTAYAVAIAGSIYTLIQAKARAVKPPSASKVTVAIVLPILLILLALTVSTIGFGGCASRQVRADESISIVIEKGPPCVVTIKADGKVASVVTGPVCHE